MLLDSHCHLTHPRLLPDLDAVMQRARDAGLVGCITIGTGVADGRAALELSRRFPDFVHCCAGLDPFTCHALGAEFEAAVHELERLLAGGGFCGLGEIGLDYHYDLDPPAVQAARLERQLELAVALDLPVVIHVRESHDDMLAVLSRHPRVRGVIHSFTAGPGEARRYLDLGFRLSINGVVTFKTAEELRRAVALVPPDRLLVETDSPYLAPVPRRGERCEPAHLGHTVEFLARLLGCPAPRLAASTTENARRLFDLPDPRPDRRSGPVAPSLA